MDDRRRDGGTNSTLRIKEQGTHLTLHEHDDDDDDDEQHEAYTTRGLHLQCIRSPKQENFSTRYGKIRNEHTTLARATLNHTTYNKIRRPIQTSDLHILKAVLVLVIDVFTKKKNKNKECKLLSTAAIKISMYVYIGLKKFFYVVRHIDSTASYLPKRIDDDRNKIVKKTVIL